MGKMKKNIGDLSPSPSHGKIGIETSSRSNLLMPIDEEKFSDIHQGPMSNTLVKMMPEDKGGLLSFGPDDSMILEKDGLKLNLDINALKNESSNLRMETYRLIDYALMNATKNKSRKIRFDLKKYNEACGNGNIDSLRREVKKDLDIIYNLSLSFTDSYYPNNKNPKEYLDIRILSAKGEISNGVVYIGLGDEFFEVLSKYPIMKYPTALFKIDGRRNANAYFLGRYLAEQKRMNKNKMREDIHSVATLLQKMPKLPSYEEVMQGGGQVKQRIIDKFEKQLDTLIEIGILSEWIYCNNKSIPITDEELKKMKYSSFINYKMKVVWAAYPIRKSK